MRARLPLWMLATLVCGCATTEVFTVPQSDWRLVPEKQRATLDHDGDAAIAAARAELRAAQIGLVAAQRSAPPARHAVAGDVERSAAIGQIETMQQAWVRATLTWNQQRVAAASARIVVVGFERELARAKAVDHTLPIGDNYEIAPYRGQFARAQEVWYSAADGAAKARDVLELAAAHVASAKEGYAALMRHSGDSDSIAAVERARRMQLTGWAVNDDVGHRHRMKYVLHETKPMLHR